MHLCVQFQEFAIYYYDKMFFYLWVTYYVLEKRDDRSGQARYVVKKMHQVSRLLD